MPSMLKNFFDRPVTVFTTAVVLRAVLLVYGHFQDEFSALKYTDIDYFVFTDAARHVAQGNSPYARDTYRYTPLLAWLLVPTSWGGWWFDYGKVLFAASDVFAGWFILKILLASGMSMPRALKFSSLWLLNPMVAQISTRGSSEGLLAAMVMALLWATLQKQFVLSGVLLGLGVHFKIYPFIYAASIFMWLGNLDEARTSDLVSSLFSKPRVTVALSSFLVFIILNAVMYSIYGSPFLLHTFKYHLVRTDHRHNFSPYNLALYLSSSPASSSKLPAESFAFLPQLLLSAVALPLMLAKLDLPSCMLAQTYAFVTFNKVCTSQYFLWYLVFLSFYLPKSTLLRKPRLGLAALGLWIGGQVLWLQQGYQLEFLGRSSFIPGLWTACLAFFVTNIWILGIIISDVRREVASSPRKAWEKKSS